MTIQSNLPLIWAETGGGSGGVSDPGDAKYSTGWVAEIPTYQNFNFVLQNHSKNFLVLAEGGTFKWEDDIEYFPGAQVIQGTTLYTCIAQHTNVDPTTDSTHSYWVLGYAYGTNSANLTYKEGLYIYDVNSRGTTTWDGNDITLQNSNALIALNTQNGSNNLVFGNVSGDLVVQNVATTTSPDGRSLTGNNKVFHQGHPPIQSEVLGTIPENPSNGLLYGRKDSSWVEVSATKVQEFPPQPVAGNGNGWYNLQDGELYIDVNDGDSSQWVPASNPKTSDIEPDINIARAGRKNIIINGDLGSTSRVNQRFFDGNWAGVSVGIYGYDRWKKSATASSIDQIVEEFNFVPNSQYVLSGVNITEEVLTSPASGNWLITVPDDAEKIQLEKVSSEYPTATEFEFRGRTEEKILCMRYYEVSWNTQTIASSYASAGAENLYFPVEYKVEKRVPPTLTRFGSFTASRVASYTAGYPSVEGFSLDVVSSSSGRVWLQSTDSSMYIASDAEL